MAPLRTPDERLAYAKHRLEELDRDDHRSFWAAVEIIEEWLLPELSAADRQVAVQMLDTLYREYGLISPLCAEAMPPPVFRAGGARR